MASDSEGLRPFHCRSDPISSCWKWLPIRKGYDIVWPRLLIEYRGWKWLPIRKGYDTPAAIAFWTLSLVIMLKMASDSEGLRQWLPYHIQLLPLSRWKWLPIRKGYDNNKPPCSNCRVDVENGFRFGRVTTGGTNGLVNSGQSVENGFRFGRVTTRLPPQLSKFLLRWKWLPIRKGYDL